MEDKKFDLAIAIALVPILGTGLVLVNQFGRFMYYGIPPELLQIDAYKVLVSSISMWLLATAMVYSGASLHSLAGWRVWERVTANLALAAVLTGPFWVRDLHWAWSISWATTAFVSFTGLVLYLAERRLLRGAQGEPRERIAGWAMVAFLGSLALLIGTFAFGFIAENTRTDFQFVDGTDNAMVATAGDVLIIKTYDRQRHCLDPKSTILLPVDASLTLVSKTLEAGTSPGSVCRNH